MTTPPEPTADRPEGDVEAIRRPRVLYLVTVEDSALFVAGQLTAVAARGFEVHFATRFHDGAPREIDPDVRSWHLPFAREPAPLDDLRGLLATFRLLRRLRPAVVHAGTPKAGLLGMTAAFVARVPVRVYAIHGLRYETLTGRRRRLLLALERLSARCATHVLADSASIRAVAIRDRLVPPAKVTVLGSGSSNGVDIDRFAPVAERTDRAAARRALGLDRFRAVVGFVGRMTHDKGVDDLVSSLGPQLGGDRAVGLLLVGPFEHGDPVSAATRAAIEHDPNIVHVPWLDDTTVAYAAMDVLAFPSYREGLPNVPLEAQASGVPVVAYAATGTVDAIAEGLVPVGDADRLADEVVALLDRPDDLARRARAGREWVAEEFSRQRVWSARADFIEGAAAARGVRPPR